MAPGRAAGCTSRTAETAQGAESASKRRLCCRRCAARLVQAEVGRGYARINKRRARDAAPAGPRGAVCKHSAAAAQARALVGRDGDKLAAAAREAGAALRLGALPPRERPSAAAPGDELAALEGAPAAVAAALRLLGQALRRWQACAAGGAAPPPQPRGGSPASARGSPAPGHEGLARRASGQPQVVLPPSRALPRSQARPLRGACPRMPPAIRMSCAALPAPTPGRRAAPRFAL